MIVIAHRGLLEGPNKYLENRPLQIEGAIKMGFDVEIDVLVYQDKIFLGHDAAEFEITEQWLTSIAPFSWIHCKNIEALLFFTEKKSSIFHYFWHEEDTVTLTSRGFIWAYPGKQPIKNSIAVMPELYKDNVSECFGICTDYSHDYRKRYES